MATIENAQEILTKVMQDILGRVLPQTAGLSLDIELLQNGVKKEKDAPRDNWDPESGEIRIRFGATGSDLQPRSSPKFAGQSEALTPQPLADSEGGLIFPETSLREFIGWVNSMESQMGVEFVEVKRVEDLQFPGERYQGMNRYEGRVRALRQAVEMGIFVERDEPNPPSPVVPVIAVRLNRTHPKVIESLNYKYPGPEHWDFARVEIQGEPLSETIIRERRGG